MCRCSCMPCADCSCWHHGIVTRKLSPRKQRNTAFLCTHAPTHKFVVTATGTPGCCERDYVTSHSSFLPGGVRMGRFHAWGGHRAKLTRNISWVICFMHGPTLRYLRGLKVWISDSLMKEHCCHLQTYSSRYSPIEPKVAHNIHRIIRYAASAEPHLHT